MAHRGKVGRGEVGCCRVPGNTLGPTQPCAVQPSYPSCSRPLHESSTPCARVPVAYCLRRAASTADRRILGGSTVHVDRLTSPTICPMRKDPCSSMPAVRRAAVTSVVHAGHSTSHRRRVSRRLGFLARPAFYNRAWNLRRMSLLASVSVKDTASH